MATINTKDMVTSEELHREDIVLWAFAKANNRLYFPIDQGIGIFCCDRKVTREHILEIVLSDLKDELKGANTRAWNDQVRKALHLLTGDSYWRKE